MTADGSARSRAARDRFVKILETHSFGALGIGTTVSIMMLTDLHPWSIWDGTEAISFIKTYPQYIESGLAIVGGCPNGDLVGVNNEGRILLSSMGDTISGLKCVEDYSIVVAPSLSDLLRQRKSLPMDWWEATERARRKRHR